jgi:hypothetical protein
LDTVFAAEAAPTGDGLAFCRHKKSPAEAGLFLSDLKQPESLQISK